MTESSLMNTYGERDTTLVKGEGLYVWNAEGKRFIDAISGIAVCGLGHCHPAVTQAINEQANQLIHCSNLYLIEPQQALGKTLLDISGMDKVFFSNSGAEANEAALKIARKFGQDQGIANPEVITADKSFHGRTMATLSATGNDKVKAGFAPYLEGFKHATFADIDAIKARANENTVAVMVEPVQGEGGVHVPYEGYLKDLRELCDAQGWLLILDEIQTGNGRTGEYFAFQHEGITPDVLTTAKGLGNGVPIGACIAKGKAAHVLQAGNHGSTFGGNPLATNAALAVVKELTSHNVIENAKVRGQQMLKAFQEALSSHDKVKDIRGKGMMIGIELKQECSELANKGKEKGILINVASGNTIRLLPPLNITQEQANTIVELVIELIDTL